MKAEEKKLLQLSRTLTPAQQDTLLAFAEFLASRETTAAPEVSAVPLDIPRPEKESVVKAIRRLAATYPMLDSAKLLHETSAYMTQHVIQGKPAAEVIDALEDFFAGQFAAHQGAAGDHSASEA
ncbi:MAG TPA: Crp/Fnr family transcriptional regulator [Betaproteobacteria bacterium]|nr:Crp/Fnr family transcriptional regulator [Betaproteobacteria bacterium]